MELELTDFHLPRAIDNALTLAWAPINRDDDIVRALPDVFSADRLAARRSAVLLAGKVEVTAGRLEGRIVLADLANMKGVGPRRKPVKRGGDLHSVAFWSQCRLTDRLGLRVLDLSAH